MKIADEDAVLIKNIYLSKGWGARKLLNEFPDKGWKLGSIDYLLKKIRKTGTVNRQQAMADRVRLELMRTLKQWMTLYCVRRTRPKRTDQRAKSHVKLAFTVPVSIGSFTVIFNSSASSDVGRNNCLKPTASPV